MYTTTRKLHLMISRTIVETAIQIKIIKCKKTRPKPRAVKINELNL